MAEAHPPAAADTHATTEAHPPAGEHHEAPAAFGMTAPMFIALAMIVVLALMAWKKVPAAIGRALDHKIAGIREQLAEAEALRKEAEALKGEYEAKAAAAEADAKAMVERARHEADALARQGARRCRGPGRAPHPHGRGQDRGRGARRGPAAARRSRRCGEQGGGAG